MTYPFHIRTVTYTQLYNNSPRITINYAHLIQDNWRVMGLDFGQRQGLYSASYRVHTDPETIQPPILWVPATVSSRIKRPGCRKEHSPQSRDQVTNTWVCTPSPPLFYLKKFDVFTAFKVPTLIFRVMTPWCLCFGRLHLEEGSSTFLRNVSACMSHHSTLFY